MIATSEKRTTGIETAFPAWKAGALAIVLHPQTLYVIASTTYNILHVSIETVNPLINFIPLTN